MFVLEEMISIITNKKMKKGVREEILGLYLKSSQKSYGELEAIVRNEIEDNDEVLSGRILYRLGMECGMEIPESLFIAGKKLKKDISIKGNLEIIKCMMRINKANYEDVQILLDGYKKSKNREISSRAEDISQWIIRDKNARDKKQKGQNGNILTPQ